MDEFLFNFSDNVDQVADQPNKNISEEGLREIRRTFELARVNDQMHRRHLVVQAIKRDVTSLRDVKQSEVKSIIYRIMDEIASQKKSSGGSAWDEREEDTWIDKL